MVNIHSGVDHSDLLDNADSADDSERRLLQQCFRVLQTHPDYRVLQRLSLTSLLNSKLIGVRVVVIDTETTGVDFNQDAIIEIGALVVQVDAETGEVGQVEQQFSGLEDPGFPIPVESIKVHGITDDMVKNRSFDDNELYNLVKDAHLIVAHNASFDRVFLEKRFPFFKNLPFACSFKQIDWRAEGFGSNALEFLLYRLGYFYESHRAVNDCEALLGLLTSPLPQSGRLPFELLFEKAALPEFVIHALDSPIELKDALKSKGFRWSATERVWKMAIIGELAGRELIYWLRSQIYRKAENEKIRLGFEKRTARERFSSEPVRVTYKDV